MVEKLPACITMGPRIGLSSGLLAFQHRQDAEAIRAGAGGKRLPADVGEGG